MVSHRKRTEARIFMRPGCFFLIGYLSDPEKTRCKCPRNAFEMDVNPIAQTTSGGVLGRIPDETGQV